jgi:short-subunit dehydrogenase
VLPQMVARGSGHIAAVASLAGYRALPAAVEYGASKAAVIHLLDGLRFDLEPKGVQVTVINPGFVRTPLTDKNRFTMPFLIEADDAAERIVRGLERGKTEIHFPAPMSWTLKLMRLLPYPLYARLIGRMSPQR